MIVLVMLTAIPMGVYAQESDSSVSPGDDVGVGIDPIPEPYIDPYYWWTPSGFDYSNGTANGTYVDFELDEATGIVSDYTVTMVRYDYNYPMLDYDLKYDDDEEGGIIEPDYDYYPSMPEPEEFTVKFFDSIEIENFVPNGHPGIFGETLTFLGEDIMMTFSDYDWSMASFMVGDSNQTIVLNVADGLNISEQPYWYDMYELDDMEYEEIIVDEYREEWEDTEPLSDDEMDGGILISGEDASPLYMDPYMEMWLWDEVYISDDDTMCSIWVDNGVVSIDGDTITITVNEGGNIGISTWIEEPFYYDPYMLDWAEDDAYYDMDIDMDSMIEEGLLAAVGYLFVDDKGEEYTDASTYNDPSFRMEFTDINEDGFEVEVESKIEEGRIVSINLNDGALDATADILVMLDFEHEIPEYDSIEDLAELVGGTEAGYYMVFGEEQSILFVYVPHFSLHTISVQSILGSDVNLLVPGMMAVAFIALAAVLVVTRNKRNKDEY